jgi:hypothetical protein
MIAQNKWKHKRGIKYNGCKETDLTMAMQTTVDPHIYMFSQDSESVCAYCNSAENLMIDHEIDFQQLIFEFLERCKSYIPFRGVDIISTRVKCFKPEDTEFEKEWAEYHKTNAILVVVCEVCSNELPEFVW